MAKHIGVFSLAYMPFVGGAEIALKEITDRSENDFACFTYKFDREWAASEKLGNVQVIRLGKGKLHPHDYYGQFFRKIVYAFRAFRAAEKLHKEKPFSMIWAMMASYAGMGALFFKLRYPEVPLLLTLQEGDSEQHILKRVGIFYPLWKLLFKKADHIQVISTYLADFARRHGAICPIEVVPNGVAVENFQFPKTNFQSISNAKNLKTIITTSRLVHKNGVDMLIKSAKELKSILKTPFVIKILGSGPDEQKLKQLASDEGVEGVIEFLGHVEPSDIPQQLSEADVFARMARSEGLGNSYLEAMAAGIPIIGTPVGGIPDFLVNDETGIFVEVDDHIDLAWAIKRIFEDDALAEKLTKNARRLIEEKYSWDSIAARMNDIFRNLSKSTKQQND